jgi:glycosyltransferase involved in cell wall biosynthesis
MKVAFLAIDNREPFKDYSNPRPHFNAGIEALMEGFAGLPDVEVHIVSCTQQPMSSPTKLAGNIWFHSLHVPKFGWLRTFYQGCIRATRCKLREIRPDIVHGYGTERDCALSAVRSGFPSVVSIQGNMAEIARLTRARFGTFYWLTARLENFTLPRAAGVIANSTYTEKLVRPRAKKVWLVFPALLPAFLEPVPNRPSGGPSGILLNVGVISPRKRQLELLDVAETLHRQGLKFELHFIGRADDSDAYTTAFRERIKPLTSAGCARYLGRVPLSDLIHHYNTAAGMIHFSSEEAFGLNVAEALARDLKFFGTRLGGIVDIAGDVPGAELFEKDDWAGLTTAIARWLREGRPQPPSTAVLMRHRYAPEAVARRHLEIYREVCHSHT